MKVLVNQNVLITGAGSGIGRLMAFSFAREKCNLVLIDINKDAVDAVAKEIASTGVKVEAYKCDISDEKNVAEVVSEIDCRFPRMDIIVNNAGIVVGKSVLSLTMKEIRRTMDVNFFGHIIFIKHYLPQMIQRNAGHIVNISSSSGLLGYPNASDYNASKFAEVGFTEALRMELKKFGHSGVKTTLVCPYAIDTGMFTGFKPLLLNPILKPDYVVKEIMEAVKKEKSIIKMPFTVSLSLFIKLFPPAFSDWIFTRMGLGNAMDNHVGRIER